MFQMLPFIVLDLRKSTGHHVAVFWLQHKYDLSVLQTTMTHHHISVLLCHRVIIDSIRQQLLTQKPSHWLAIGCFYTNTCLQCLYDITVGYKGTAFGVVRACLTHYKYECIRSTLIQCDYTFPLLPAILIPLLMLI